MKITEMAVQRSTTVIVLLLLILVTGTVSYNDLPRENYPEIIIPLIVVTTVYDGVAPTDIETLVTVPIERKLTGIAGVEEIASYSAESISSITIEFTPDIDIDTALQKVRDKVDQAKPDLPPDAEDPAIREINFSEFPIMFLSLTGEVGLPILNQLAEALEDELEAIQGVLEVDVIGGIEREIQIIVDPDLTREYGVSMMDLVQLAQVENVNTPAGSMELGEAKYLIRVPGEFSSTEEIENLVVKANDDGIVFMRDIAVIQDDFKDVETKSRLDGVEAVTLTVTKRSGENVIHVSDAVREVCATAQERMLGGVDIHVTMDQSNDIREMVAELENSILSGLILVLIVIFIFLGFSNAIFVAMAIPISMLMTFVALSITDTTMNMVVLFSLILALGMLVDNGIVVVENIYRHIQRGVPRVEAARKGAAEVAWPITASTMTTIAAFSPMFFWPGIWGEFMKYLPLTLTFSLTASLFVGLVVNPALASIFMRKPKKVIEKKHKPFILIRIYTRILRFCLQWRLPVITLAVTTLLVIVNVFMATALVEFEPEVEPGRGYIDVDNPQGTNLDVTNALIGELEVIAEDYRGDVEFIVANVGSYGASRNGESRGGESNIGRVTLDFPPLQDSKVMPSTILQELRGKVDHFVGTEIKVDESSEGPDPKPPINIEITGDNYEYLADIAQEIKEIVKAVPSVINPNDDYDKGKPELKVNVDREQALVLGLNTQFIGQTVQAAVNGIKAGEYRDGDEEYDVMVRFPKSFREDLANIEAMSMVNLRGEAVPFASVAKLEQSSGLGFIHRIDRKRTVTVSADVEPGVNGNEVLGVIRDQLESFDLPPGYNLSYTGENEDMEKSQQFLMRAFIVALFLIALILITQFNSVIQPLIIMSSVVLSLAGVFLGLYVFDMPFGVLMSGIGCISLAGVVVNNAIVLLDFINQRRAQGTPTEDAIVEAGATRFRPVMLTAITTILGLIPMAMGVSFDFRNGVWISGGESSQYWGPMAISVIFGLAFATLLTLIVVPVLYSLSVSFTSYFYPPTSSKATAEAASE